MLPLQPLAALHGVDGASVSGVADRLSEVEPCWSPDVPVLGAWLLALNAQACACAVELR